MDSNLTVERNELAARFMLRLRELANQGRFGKIRTQNAPFQKLLGIIVRLLESPSLPITLWGEVGSGKKTLAKEIASHANLISRLEGVEVFPTQYIRSEELKSGFSDTLLKVQGGVLVFQNLELLSKELQKEMLDYLKTRESSFQKTSQQESPRVIFLTSYSLSFKVLKKEFSKDLFQFLNPTLLCVPSLNERLDDLPLLISEILMDLTGKTGHSIEPSLVDHLEIQIWGQNITQLKKEIEIRFKMGMNPNRWTLNQWHSVFELKSPANSGFKKSEAADFTAKVERRKKLQFALHRAGGDRDAAARLLGVSKVELLKAIFAEGLR